MAHLYTLTAIDGTKFNLEFDDDSPLRLYEQLQSQNVKLVLGPYDRAVLQKAIDALYLLNELGFISHAASSNVERQICFYIGDNTQGEKS